MAKLKFPKASAHDYRLTGTGCIVLSDAAFSVGADNIVGGYGFKITGYNAEERTLTLDPDTSMFRFTASQNIYITAFQADAKSPQWAKIIEVDELAKILTLEDALQFGGNVVISPSTPASGMVEHLRGTTAFAAGYRNIVAGAYSYASGYQNIALRECQDVHGRYNLPDNHGADGNADGFYVSIWGNGTSESRANAAALTWSGHLISGATIAPADGALWNGSFALYDDAGTLKLKRKTANGTISTITLNGGGKTKVVTNIAARNALPGVVEGDECWVVDATADATVTSGAAKYLHNGTSWIKTAEAESMDVILYWANIQNKPNFHAVATSGNYNDLINKPDLGGGSLPVTALGTSGTQTLAGGMNYTLTPVSAVTLAIGTFTNMQITNIEITNGFGLVSFPIEWTWKTAIPTLQSNGIDYIRLIAVNNNGTINILADRIGRFLAPVATSYANPGGTGNRTSIISTSQGVWPRVGSTASLLVNGVTSGSNDCPHIQSTTVVGGYSIFDFGSAKIINEIKWYATAGSSDGYWNFVGSNNGVTWSSPLSEVDMLLIPDAVFPLVNNTAYRYYKLYGVSGTHGATGYWLEIEFKIN